MGIGESVYLSLSSAEMDDVVEDTIEGGGDGRVVERRSTKSVRACVSARRMRTAMDSIEL